MFSEFHDKSGESDKNRETPDQIGRVVISAVPSHMVQNPPYWMAKECSRFEDKAIPTCQAGLSFVFNVPVENINATLFTRDVL